MIMSTFAYCYVATYNWLNVIILSLAFQCSWMEPLFWAGVRKKELQQKDLPEPPDYTSSEKLQHTFQK